MRRLIKDNVDIERWGEQPYRLVGLTEKRGGVYVSCERKPTGFDMPTQAREKRHLPSPPPLHSLHSGTGEITFFPFKKSPSMTLKIHRDPKKSIYGVCQLVKMAQINQGQCWYWEGGQTAIPARGLDRRECVSYERKPTCFDMPTQALPYPPPTLLPPQWDGGVRFLFLKGVTASSKGTRISYQSFFLSWSYFVLARVA